VFNFSWVLERRLAGSGRPGWPGDLVTDLRFLHDQGIRAIVGFVEDGVTMDYGAAPGIEFEALVFEVDDHTAPALDVLDEGIAFIDRCLAADLPVAVHCLAGIGRTGTLLACYLARRDDTSGDAAIRQLRELRPASIETPDQEARVREYARHYGLGAAPAAPGRK